MKTLIFLSFLLTMYYISSAQQSNNNITVAINSNAALTGNQFKIEIVKRNNIIKITYYLLDSISYKMLWKNSRYVSLMKNFLPQSGHNINPDSLKKINRELETLTEAQKHYSKDSLLLQPVVDTAYASLLYKLSITNKDTLENEIANRSRIVLDGVRFGFNIKNDTAAYRVSANSPTSTSHPLLYHFIHETLEIYRRKKATGFLNKFRTNGY